MDHHVIARKLNLRDRARSGDGADALGRIRVTLVQGDPFRRIGPSARQGWWQVEALHDGILWQGELNAAPDYVQPLGASPVWSPVPTAPRVTEASLGRLPAATRTAVGNWAFSLGEPGAPGRAAAHVGGPAAGIRAILDWLDVGNPSHGRWWPSAGKTYCNVYVHDVCDLAGCYMPRVWWTNEAYHALRSGQTVAAVYGKTVIEYRANDLFLWLAQHGPAYGWVRVQSVDALQSAANAGQIAVIAAQHENRARSGHIQIVAPEAPGLGQVARRRNGIVTQPLQSNAGTRNFRYGQLRDSWWLAITTLRDFSFWVNNCSSAR
ncbi:MAG: hypothetical protein SNJ79_12155 [Sphingomonadaceae bacterium]